MIRILVNKRIESIISDAIYSFPELRFNQILHDLKVISDGDSFFVEPEVVLGRIINSELYKKMYETNGGGCNGVFG